MRLDLWGCTTYMGRWMSSTSQGVTQRSTDFRSRFNHCDASVQDESPVIGSAMFYVDNMNFRAALRFRLG